MNTSIRVQGVNNWWGDSIHVIDNQGRGHVKISIENDAPNIGIISDLVVISTSRGRGIATNLLKECIHQLKLRKVKVAHLAAQKGGIADKWYDRIAEFIDEDEHFNYYLIRLG